jgi:hypothetical protein
MCQYGAFSRYSLYLLLFKRKSKRMPLLSGLGNCGIKATRKELMGDKKLHPFGFTKKSFPFRKAES